MPLSVAQGVHPPAAAQTREPLLLADASHCPSGQNCCDLGLPQLCQAGQTSALPPVGSLWAHLHPLACPPLQGGPRSAKHAAESHPPLALLLERQPPSPAVSTVCVAGTPPAGLTECIGLRTGGHWPVQRGPHQDKANYTVQKKFITKQIWAPQSQGCFHYNFNPHSRHFSYPNLLRKGRAVRHSALAWLSAALPRWPFPEALQLS